MASRAVPHATGETVGVARLAREDDPNVAEFAVVVQPDEKGHGLGVRLMQRVLDWGRRHGVREVVGEILAENAPMLDLARFLGFRLRHLPADPTVIEARMTLLPPAAESVAPSRAAA
jgi:acetyltransferase